MAKQTFTGHLPGLVAADKTEEKEHAIRKSTLINFMMNSMKNKMVFLKVGWECEAGDTLLKGLQLMMS